MQPIPPDLIQPILFECDVRTNIAFSITCKSIKEHVSSLISELNDLLDFCKKTYNNDPYPSLGKRIFTIWTSLDKLKTIEKIETVFDCLKFFYEVIPQDQQVQVLQLPCPFFIKKMLLSNPKDDDLWMKLEHPAGSRVDSIVHELEKIELYEENSSQFQAKLCRIPFSKHPGGVFVKVHEVNVWKTSICLLMFINGGGPYFHHLPSIKTSCSINMKWEYIKDIYKKAFIDPLSTSTDVVLTPVSDLRVKMQRYLALYSQITSMEGIFHPKISKKNMAEIKASEYRLRYSTSEEDEYGNWKIVLIAKTPNWALFNLRLDGVEDLQDLDQFKQMLKEEICKPRIGII